MNKHLTSTVTSSVSYTLSVVEKDNGKLPTLNLLVCTPNTRDGWEAQSIGSVRRPHSSAPDNDCSVWSYPFDGDKLSVAEHAALWLIRRMEMALRARQEEDAQRLERYYDLDNCIALGKDLQLEDLWKKLSVSS